MNFPTKNFKYIPTAPNAPEQTKMSATAQSTVNYQRQKLRSKEEFIIMKEIAAARAHLEAYDLTNAKFYEATQKFTANPRSWNAISSLQLHERFKERLSKFEKEDASDRFRFGTDEELWKLDSLLMEINFAVQNARNAENAAKLKKDASEKRKLEAKKQIIEIENCVKSRFPSGCKESDKNE